MAQCSSVIIDLLFPDKKKREEEKAKKDANDRDISEYFMKGRTAPQPKTKVYTHNAYVASPQSRET